MNPQITKLIECVDAMGECLKRAEAARGALEIELQEMTLHFARLRALLPVSEKSVPESDPVRQIIEQALSSGLASARRGR